MTEEKLRRVDPQPECPCSWCDRPAVLVRQWRTERMPCSAYWYYCEECAEERLELTLPLCEED